MVIGIGIGIVVSIGINICINIGIGIHFGNCIGIAIGINTVNVSCRTMRCDTKFIRDKSGNTN